MDYSHQTDIFDPAVFRWPVHLIGVGGIGGSLVLPLIKLGIAHLTVWDDDLVEEHNIPSQLIYTPDDIGKPKVQAVAEFAARYGVEITPRQERVTSDTTLQGIVISGVDSMASRQAIWEVVHFDPEIPLYLDGRVGGEVLQLYACFPFDLDSADFYEATLFSDAESEPDACAARAVIHPVLCLASLIIAQITLYARGKEVLPEISFDLLSMQLLSNTLPEEEDQP
jgi:hypothetical protein